ncbi:hypothetical protein GOODEAATRI_005313 [Goodea atripinnis]|uniref:Uncharacterized protein n=1 Tax=Goodea atripinnis TaxID=208336 RepID=A0ABV0MQP4_9TELE
MLSESSKAKSGLNGEMGEFCAVWVGVWREGGLTGGIGLGLGFGGGGSASPVDFNRETFCDDLSFSANWLFSNLLLFSEDGSFSWCATVQPVLLTSTLKEVGRWPPRSGMLGET